MFNFDDENILRIIQIRIFFNFFFHRLYLQGIHILKKIMYL